MNTGRIHKRDLLTKLGSEWPQDVLPEIRKCLHANNRKIVVLDDDPTGTQTVHNLPVLTEWGLSRLIAEFNRPDPVFYILTNSRSLSTEGAILLNREIGNNLKAASLETGRDFVVISRSDSTLRGHFPAETDALAAVLGGQFDGCVLIPFFLEGGRYTINDVHFVQQADTLVPVADTPFAQDKVFGFTNSNLRAWVAEKTTSRISPEDVVSITIEDLRQGGPEAIKEKLAEVKAGRACIVNAASMRDVEVFTLGALMAEDCGQRFIYRTAASFARSMAGLTAQPLIKDGYRTENSGGVLIVAGSYVPKTTRQIETLLRKSDIVGIEIDVESLLNIGQATAEIKRAADLADAAISARHDVLAFTSRELISSEIERENIDIGRAVSDCLVNIVKTLKSRPSCIVAKGGITSSDIATEAIGIRRGWVKGQILPGVPVWECGPETRWPGMRYIVFPGNVGEDEALLQTLRILRESAPWE